MTFNELNTVEYYVIQNLSGANLNSDTVDDSTDKNRWLYKSSDRINRDTKDIIIEEEVRINSTIQINKKPELANEVIYRLRAILTSVIKLVLLELMKNF